MPGGKTKCRKHSRSAPAAFASDRRISFGRVAGLPGDPQCVPCNIAAQDTQRLHRASSLPCGAICTLSGWDELPSSALSHVFDQLAPRDLAAAAITCKAWHREAVHDNRWEQYWRNDVGDQSLWGWARAGGGYREQLKARASVRKGKLQNSKLQAAHLQRVVCYTLASLVVLTTSCRYQRQLASKAILAL